jgi:thioredoxin-related protein
MFMSSHNKSRRLPASLFLVSLIVLALPLHAADLGPDKGKFYGAKKTEYPAWFKESFLDFNEDIAEATQANKRVMLLFHQDGCPYCNALVEQNLAQKDIETKVRKNFDVIAINMWGDRELTIKGKTFTEKSFAKALKVQFTPTILFFNEQGKVILRLNGYIPPRRFKVAIDYVAGKHEKKTSYRDYVRANLPPGKTGALHKEDFFAKPPYDLSRHKGKKPYALFFEQKDCPACDTLHQNVLVDQQTRDVIANFDVVQLDMWSDTPVINRRGKRTTARKLAQALDIKYAPTIVIFNKQGKEIIRSEAFFKTFHTQGMFTYVLSGKYKTEPSFQRYLSDKAKRLQEQGLDVDIWKMADEPG